MSNNLSDLYQKMADKKISLPTKGFAGQHTNPHRQNKNKMMRALGIKTGKAYRKYVKKLNNENRGN